MTLLIETVSSHPVAGSAVLIWSLVSIALAGEKARDVARAWRSGE